MNRVSLSTVTPDYATLLNWNHETKPTPVADFLLNVQEEIYYAAKWTHMSASFDNNILKVECGKNSTKVLYTLVYNAVDQVEVEGSLANVGLAKLADQIHAMVQA